MNRKNPLPPKWEKGIDTRKATPQGMWLDYRCRKEDLLAGFLGFAVLQLAVELGNAAGVGGEGQLAGVEAVAVGAGIDLFRENLNYLLIKTKLLLNGKSLY